MSNKYIIKNCPACLPMTKLCDSENTTKAGMYCWDCTDCVMKQIVERCKHKMDTEFNSGSMFAEEILQLFDIEEVE